MEVLHLGSSLLILTHNRQVGVAIFELGGKMLNIGVFRDVKRAFYIELVCDAQVS